MSQQNSKKLVVIAGPTAVGKTALAIKLAQALDTEIVSADSRQIFKELTIGTAKPSEEELKVVRHYFIDTHAIKETYNAAQYGADALPTIQEILARKNYAILCGGSGLYMKAVLEGFDNIPEVSPEIRDTLMEQYNRHGLSWLQQQLQAADAAYFSIIDRQNPHRLIRGLEVKMATGMSILSFQRKEKTTHDFQIVKIGLEIPRDQLYARIDSRMDLMIEQGLFKEAEALYPLRHYQALQTVGYQEIFDFIDGHYDHAEAVRLLKRNSRRYAKRQLTWFKRDEDMRWFNPDDFQGIINFVNSKPES